MKAGESTRSGFLLSFRVAACVAVGLATAIADAADIHVLSTPTLKSVLLDLQPEFERTTGHRLLMQFDSVSALKRRIEAGEPFDVTVLLPAAISDLERQHRVAEKSAFVLARASVGIAVRADDPHPPVRSIDDLKRLLADSNSFAYAADSASGAYFLKVLDSLQVPDARTKLKVVPGGRVIDAIARGEADLTVITAPNIVGVPGVRLAGLLPEELQSRTEFSAALAAAASDEASARSLLQFLKSEAAGAVFVRRGFERVAP